MNGQLILLSPFTHFLSDWRQVKSKMKFMQVFLVVAVLISTALSAEETARSEISEQDLDRALSDRRYLTRQLKCTLGEVPCDQVGKRLKSLAPLVLRGSCPQCSPQEMRQIQKVLAHVQKNYPKEWNKMLQLHATG